jgi:hypothetical protein
VWGVDVDGLAYPLHQPRGQSLPASRHLVSSFVVGGGAFRGKGSVLGVDIRWRLCLL